MTDTKPMHCTDKRAKWVCLGPQLACQPSKQRTPFLWSLLWDKVAARIQGGESIPEGVPSTARILLPHTYYLLDIHANMYRLWKSASLNAVKDFCPPNSSSKPKMGFLFKYKIICWSIYQLFSISAPKREIYYLCVPHQKLYRRCLTEVESNRQSQKEYLE